MIGMPEWAAAVPSTPGVHPPPGQSGTSRPFTTEQLLQLGEGLLEQLLRRIVLAVTNAFLPDLPAFDQLMQWAENVGNLLWWLEIDELLALIGDSVGSLLGINWFSPTAIWEAITVAWDFWRGVGSWVLHVLSNITSLDLSEQGAFLTDLAGLFAFDELQAAWVQFWHGWNDINWSNPLTGIHQAWMLLVDFVWDAARWVAHVLSNLTGITAPGWFALDQLTALWGRFTTSWNAINWGNPLTAIHQAWMAVVDLGWDLWDWFATVIANLTGISIPSFLNTAALRATWTTFFTGWGAINWGNPLTAIHQGWMLIVDLAAGLWAWFKSVLTNLTGITLPSFLNGDQWKQLWQDFTDAWAAITWNTLGALWDALSAVVTLIRSAVHWAVGVLRNLTGIDLEVIAQSFNLDGLAAAFTTWADTLLGINWANPIAGLMTAIGAFFQLFRDVGTWLLGLLEDWLGWSVAAVGGMFSSVQNFIFRITEYVWGETGLGGLINVIEKLAGFAGATIVQAITGAYAEAARLVNLIGSFLNLGGLVDFVEGILGEDGLLGFLVRIPFIGPLVSAITGITPDEGTALDLTTLVTWARGLLTGNSPIPGGNIVGQISEAILSVIPVANISALSPNLLSQGNFNNNLTVSEGGGWSWDGTSTATGTGGSAKLVATGATQELFSRQAVKVNAGDRVDVSCKVKTSGFTAGAGRSMVLSIIPWTMFGGAMIQQPTITVATRTTSATSWSDMTGTTWTVPANVVRLTVRLAVTANDGAVVWFDDAKVSKSGELGQNLVESLITAWNHLIGGLTNPVAGAAATTGKTWADLFSGASAFRSVYNVEESRGQTLRLNLFGSPTTVGTAVQLAAVPDIPRSKSSDMQSIINNLFRGLLGDAPVNMDTADVLTAAAQTAANVAAAKAAVTALEAKAAAGSFSGVAQAVDFAAYADGALPSSVFEVNANVWTGSPAGSGQFRIRSGRAAHVTTGLDNRRSIAVHKTPTATAWQKVTAVLATQSASYQSTTAAVYLGARLNSTGTTGIYARLSGGSPVQLVDGSGSVLWTASIAAAFSGTYTLEVGVGASENRVRVFWEGLSIIDQTFGSLPSGGRYTAIGGEARSYSRGGGSYTALPGEIAAMTFYDNKPAETLGSHFLVRRTNTAVESISATAAALVPGGFFAGPELRTADLTWDGATNKLTVTVTGTYLVTVALKREAFTNTQWSAAAAVFVNDALHSIGHRQSGIFINTGGVAVGNRGAVTVTVPVYLQKDDYIQPGYASSDSSGLTGSAFCETYMSVAFIGNTKPVQPVAA